MRIAINPIASCQKRLVSVASSQIRVLRRASWFQRQREAKFLIWRQFQGCTILFGQTVRVARRRCKQARRGQVDCGGRQGCLPDILPVDFRRFASKATSCNISLKLLHNNKALICCTRFPYKVFSRENCPKITMSILCVCASISQFCIFIFSQHLYCEECISNLIVI